MSKSLTAVVRERVGKTSSRQLRQDGKIPAVVYGNGQPIHIVLNEREFNKEFKHLSESTIIDLNIGGKVRKVLVKDYQDDILKNKILHLDFLEIDQSKSIRTHVPFHVVGTAIGQKEGGILELIAHSIEIDCLPQDLPASIDIDVSALALGQTIHLRDLTPPKGVHFHGSPDMAIVHVTTAKEHNLSPQTEEVASAGADAAAAKPEKEK